jgi:hypothetical protein
MNLNEIKDIIDKINIFNIPYDVGVFNIKDLQKQQIDGNYTYPIQSPQNDIQDLINDEDFEYMVDNFNSAVVFAFFTSKTIDYTVKEDITNNLLNWLKYNTNYKFYYDWYGTFRKTAAVYAGLGKIASNKLFFSRKFGFNCKIDMIITKEKFDNYNIFNNNYKLGYCDTCEEFCKKSCPVNAFDNKLYWDFRKACGLYLNNQIREMRMIDSIDFEVCYNCIMSCPYSNKLLNKIPKKIRDRRIRSGLLEWPFIPESLIKFCIYIDEYKNKKDDGKHKNNVFRKIEG